MLPPLTPLAPLLLLLLFVRGNRKGAAASGPETRTARSQTSSGGTPDSMSARAAASAQKSHCSASGGRSEEEEASASRWSEKRGGTGTEASALETTTPSARTGPAAISTPSKSKSPPRGSEESPERSTERRAGHSKARGGSDRGCLQSPHAVARPPESCGLESARGSLRHRGRGVREVTQTTCPSFGRGGAPESSVGGSQSWRSHSWSRGEGVEEGEGGGGDGALPSAAASSSPPPAPSPSPPSLLIVILLRILLLSARSASSRGTAADTSALHTLLDLTGRATPAASRACRCSSRALAARSVSR